MSRANQWFVAGEGIAREVITADIQRYLGPDALVRPGPGTGEFQGQNGYWITAYRTLTSQMIADLKLDSQRWQQEQGRQEAGRGVAYQDSRTHAARQHWGPSETREQPARAAPAPAQYASNDQHYTTAPAAPYGTPHSAAYPQASSYASAPRTAPEYAGYPPAGREYQGYAAPQQYAGYSQPAAQEAYRQQPPPPTHGYAAPRVVPAPGYYIASDGQQYPLAAQQPQQSSNNRRRPA